MLFHVYGEKKPDDYFVHEPFSIYRTILDADWVMYLLLPMLFVAVAVGLMYLWRFHELPKHKADQKKMRQAELVSALTLLGLFEHWVWVLAVLMAYTDWRGVEDFWVGVLRRSREVTPPQDSAQNEGSAS